MENKYGRLYPEKAVAPLRKAMLRLLNHHGTVATPNVKAECYDALEDLDSLGFPPDEPLFLLRGQDDLAPEAVRHYIEDVERTGAFGGLDRNGEAVQQIIDHADDMERWQPRKLPD